MWLVQLLCTDDGCAEEIEAVVDDLEEIEELACTCGCTYALLGISEVELVAR